MDLVDQPVLYRHQLTIIIVVDAPILIFEMPHHLDHHAIRLGSRGDHRESAALGAVQHMQRRNKRVVIQEIGRAHAELQSLMRISYAVFCLKKKNTATLTSINSQ